MLDDWGFARLTSLGRGTTALFAGPSGTGKTMAAQVLARSLGLDLYRVDLAGVVSKYIGETEKHLRELFEACERAPVLLLFDEADALFGKRTQVSDAHDRYANIEIDYVLQRMEQFDGLAVLATNRKGDLDTAFVRRLRFIIDFAPPGAVGARAAVAARPGGRQRRRGQAAGRRARLGGPGARARPDRRGHQVGGAGRGVPGAERGNADRRAARAGGREARAREAGRRRPARPDGDPVSPAAGARRPGAGRERAHRPAGAARGRPGRGRGAARSRGSSPRASRPACPGRPGAGLGRLRVEVTADAAEQGSPDLLARRIAGEIGRVLARGQGPGRPGRGGGQVSGFVLKGALVEFMPTFLPIPVPNVIVFQYNPETMTHTWTQPMPTTTPGPRPATRWRCRACRVRRSPSRSRWTPGDEIADGSAPAAALAAASGIYSRLAALEMLLYPAGTGQSGLIGDGDRRRSGPRSRRGDRPGPHGPAVRHAGHAVHLGARDGSCRSA